MKKNSIIIMLVAAMSIALSCKKFVEVDTPKTELLTAQAFLKDNSATSAVLGIYTDMLNNTSFVNSGITIYSGLSADEFSSFLEYSEITDFQVNQLKPTNANISSIWTAGYKNLIQINTCIEGLQGSNSLTPAIKSQLLGESKFCRAFIYFYLLNLFGNIPLVTSTSYAQNVTLSQSKPADVYSLIISDLKDAQANLVNGYVTSARARPNKLAATALLARVYLYVDDNVNAEIQASAVIGSGVYGPLPALSGTFLQTSTETIWQLPPVSNVSATQEGYAFLADIQYGYPDYYFSEDLINSFEAKDRRKTEWIGVINNENQDYYYPYKYKDIAQYLPATINESYVVLRLSEQYLIRAEALAKQNKLSDALADINVVRKRAGLDDFTSTAQTTVLNAIATENRHEFFAEWGHRWLDLKRTGKADAVLSLQKPAWKSTAALFPIPQTEINLARNLVQNPGY